MQAHRGHPGDQRHVLLLTCGTFLAYELSRSDRRWCNLSTLARVIAANSTAALAFDNPGMRPVCCRPSRQSSMSSPQVSMTRRAGCLQHTRSRLGTDVFPARPERDGYRFSRTRLTLYQPVVNADRRLGTLYLQSDLAALYERLSAVRRTDRRHPDPLVPRRAALSTHLQGHISRPVLALVRTATAVAEQRDYSARADRFGDENSAA